MSEPSVELIFGMKAGAVWKALNENGPSNIEGIVKATKLRRELVFGALGWLGRENKIVVERKGRAMVFSLREYEPQSESVKDTIMEDCTPKRRPTRRKFKAPKKTKKAGEIKPPAKNIESAAKQVDRTEEFLLH